MTGKKGMIGNFHRNPCLTVSDKGFRNTIYLEIVDLDKNPRNR